MQIRKPVMVSQDRVKWPIAQLQNTEYKQQYEEDGKYGAGSMI